MKKTKKFLSIFAILFVAIFALSCCFFAACGSKDDDDDKDNTETVQPDDEGAKDNEGTDDDDETEDEKKEDATVTSVTVAPTTLALVVGGNDGTLTATVTMTDESNYTGSYTWASSGENIATVTGNGATATVKAVSAGDTTITVTVDGGQYATCTVTVTEADPYTEVKNASELNTALGETSYIRIADNITVESTVEISGEVTIDLNGKSIQTENLSSEQLGNAYNTVTIEENGYLTVIDNSEDGNGSIENSYTGNTSADNAAAIYSEGNVVLKGGTVQSDSVGIRAKAGYVVVDGGNIDSVRYTIWTDAGNVTVIVLDGEIHGEEKGIFLGGDNGNFGISYTEVSDDAMSTLYVCGGEIICDTESAICTLGRTSPESVEIYIYDGEITGMTEIPADQTATGAAPAIFMASGNLCVEGGTITGTTAIEVRGGTTKISGGTIITTADPLEEDERNAENTTHGAATYGYSLAVFPYGGGVTVERGSSDIAITDPVTVEVSGGTFEGAVYGVTQDVWSQESSSYTWQEYTFSITGGSFSENPADYLDCDVYEANLVEGYYVVTVVSNVDGEAVTFTYNFTTIYGDEAGNANLDIPNSTTTYFSEASHSTTSGGEILSYTSGNSDKIQKNYAPEPYNTNNYQYAVQPNGETSSSGRYFTIDLSEYAGKTVIISTMIALKNGGSMRIVNTSGGDTSSTALASTETATSDYAETKFLEYTGTAGVYYINFAGKGSRVYEISITIG